APSSPPNLHRVSAMWSPNTCSGTTLHSLAGRKGPRGRVRGVGRLHDWRTARCCSVAVVVRLVRAGDVHADVLRLLLRELHQLGAQGRLVQASDLLVERILKTVHVVRVVRDARISLG